MKTEYRVALMIIVSAAAVFASWSSMAFREDPPAFVFRETDTAQHTFNARALYAASDLDMVGSSYVNGVLKPISGAFDVLSRVDVQTMQAQSSTSAVSNSVTGWPGVLELSPDVKHAYVIETLGKAPPFVEQVKSVYTDLSKGSLLTTLELKDSDAPRVIDQREVGPGPFSVHPAPNGNWLAVTVRDDATPFAFVILKAGVPIEIRRPTITLPTVPKPALDPEALKAYVGSSFARISPDGRTLAAHIYSSHIAFGEIVFDKNNLPIDVRFGAAMSVGKSISVGRWSLDGHYYVVADTGWGPNGNALGAGPGQLTSIAIDKLSGKIVSNAKVSLGPEGMEMNRTGDLFVAVNMENTYLPGKPNERDADFRLVASLSLVSFDAKNGALRTVDGPLAFKGALPEDAVFDRDSNMIAVAIFNDRAEMPTDGWVEFFSIDRSSGSPKLSPTGKRIRLPRGVHDLAVAY